LVRVLVVQPPKALAQATGRHLRGRPWSWWPTGCRVRIAVTDPPTAVLVDLTLPALDGWCVPSHLGARIGPPIVAYGPVGDASRAMLLGAVTCDHHNEAVVTAMQRLFQRVTT
jgi:hypothetical protein